MRNKQTKAEKILKDISNKTVRQKEDVIYGIYDNSNESSFTKLNDFIIDHSKVSLAEKAYFFHLLAVMVDSGIQVLQALDVLSAKTQNKRFQRIINTLKHSTEAGNSLSDSMSRFNDVFTTAEIGVVRAGEAAGNLDKMLFRLSEQTERSHDLQIKVFTAAFYPMIVFIVLIAVAIVMIVGVVPVLTDLLLEAGLDKDQFPLPTRMLVGTSDFLIGYWWLLILGLLIVGGIYKLYAKSDEGRLQIDYLKLKLPVVGNLLRKVLVLRFVSMLGILLDSGLPVIRSLQITQSLMNSAPYEIKLIEVIKKVQEGQKISDNLMDTPFLFPGTVTSMISIGEKSASIGPISQKIAKHYDTEIDHTIKRLTAVFEPIMIIIVGIVIVLLALAILLPIFTFTSAV